MSTDFHFQCHTCRVQLHAGQRMGGLTSYSWGYGGDDANGRALVARWAMEHAGEGHDMRLVVNGDPPDDWVTIWDEDMQECPECHQVCSRRHRHEPCGMPFADHALAGPVDDCSCRECRKKRVASCPRGQRLL